MPRVSVILPVYNAGQFLRAAIDSILRQSFVDFELIIINDGSTDDSASVVAAMHDPRIQYYEQQNQGLRATLNRCLELSQGEYIARMDQDDISLPDRLQKQVDFLTAHSDHILVGTTFAYMNQAGQSTGVFPALLDNDDLQREVLTQSPFGHGTVMFRAAALQQGKFRYAQDAVHVEDYELWLRLSRVGKVANLPEVLYLWRYYPGSTSGKHAPLQRRSAQALRDRAYLDGRAKAAIAWPGWQSLRRYHNEQVVVQGHRLRLERRHSQCLMYLNLAMLFIRHSQFWSAAKAISYSLLIQPFYPGMIILRRLFRPHENLYSQ